MKTPALTSAELIFIRRMADEIAANPGLTIQQAALAVRDRDRQLAAMATAKTAEGAAIRDALAEQTYAAIRAKG